MLSEQRSDATVASATDKHARRYSSATRPCLPGQHTGTGRPLSGAGSGQVGLWPGQVTASVRSCPDEGARAGLGQSPAGGLLGAVMSPTAGATVALARPAALVVGDRVLEIAGHGGAATSRSNAGDLPYLDQVR